MRAQEMAQAVTLPNQFLTVTRGRIQLLTVPRPLHTDLSPTTQSMRGGTVHVNSQKKSKKAWISPKTQKNCLVASQRERVVLYSKKHRSSSTQLD